MTRDDNKKIQSITYNYLNKPEIITTDSGSIYYVYDAAGNLRQKRINKGGTVEKYEYCGKIIFKDSIPQYILNEEGRARPVANDTTEGYTRYVYDYFIKDHLGNVRSTITVNPINQAYLAQHEIATASVEQLVFDNIPNVRDTKPGSGNPNDGMAAHLVASDPDQRVGTAIMLKVMPGDKFSISAKTYYEGAYTETEETGSGPALESLLSALMGGGTYAGVPVSELPENIQAVQGIFANPALASRVADLQAINNDPAVPKAHLNYLFFNDNFELQPDMSGAIQVQPNTGGGWQSTGNHNPCNCTTVATPGGTGYLLVYVDNQSIGKDVWFDDIHLEHYNTYVLEESHYYPFGLTVKLDQAGQSNLPNQPYKYQGKELEKSFGLEMYDFGARMIDPQLGRTWQLDPHADLYPTISPYASMNNSPPNYVDPNGKDARLGMQRDDKGNTTITLSSTIYVKGYDQKGKVEEYNQFLKDNAGLLSNTTKNEDGTTTTVNIDMQYVEATDKDVARVTNEETRNGDNLMLIGGDEARSSASFLDKKVTDPGTGEVTTEKFTAYSARLGGKSEHYGSSKTAFHETMHLFGLRDWYKTAEDRYKVGFHDMMNNHGKENTKPVMHQIHWNSWGKAAQEQQQRSGTNNFILNRPVETE